MSRIEFIPVELSEVVKESNLIVEVECLKPFKEEIVVKGITNAKPFMKEGFEYKVTNILKNSGKVTVPKTISVPKENWRRSLAEYKNQYGDGPSKSYKLKEYETEVESMQDADILFLHNFQDSYELEVKGSFESKEALEKITILIGQG